jgi:hypothetical protein
MDDQQRVDLINGALVEAVKELVIYKNFVALLCAGAHMTRPDLDEMLSGLRGDGETIQRLQQDWQAHLEAKTLGASTSPCAVLHEFVEGWRLLDPARLN